MQQLLLLSAIVLAALPVAACQEMPYLILAVAEVATEAADSGGTSTAADDDPVPADEREAEQAAGPAVQPTGPVPAHVVERRHAEGLQACEVVGAVADEAGYAAAREQLLDCWNKRYDSAKEACSKRYGAPGPPCYAAIEARENRETALSAFDSRWKEASAR